MRCTIFVGAGSPLAIEERPIPIAGEHQAVIRVERCGICGSDLHMTSGGQFDVPNGTALGHEYAGEIVAVGPGEARLRIGDRVTALPMSGCGHCPACISGTPLHCSRVVMMTGGFGEYTLVDQRLAMRLPASLSFADGALVEPLASSLRGVRKLRIPKGARVAVLGVGAIGVASIFWADRLGAGRIAAVALSDSGAEIARAVGATAMVTAGEGLADRVHTALGGAPDIVIEAAGTTGALQQAIDLVHPTGKVLSLGGCSVPDTISPMIGMMKEVDVLFSAAYALGDFEQAIDTLDAGAVSPRAMVGETIGLSALPAQFEAMRSGRNAGKVMVAPGKH